MQKNSCQNSQSQRKTILIVEDDPIHMKVMAKELRDRYELELAVDGQTAMFFLSREHAAKFDLVILDLKLPAQIGDWANVAVGLQVLDNCKQEHVVILVSGELTGESRSTIENSGVVRKVIEKPFSPMNFREYIDELLGGEEDT